LVTFQMTYLGAPMVYYGDEVGMYGADDPNDRKPMLWADRMPYDDPNERIEQDVFEHYRRMIAIRNSLPALQLGSFRPLLADDAKGVFAFARSLDTETIVVVLNNGDRPYPLDIPVPWADGSTAVRMDDPKACEIASPSKKNPASRPMARPVRGRPSPLKVTNGRLRGITLEPYTGGVFIQP
ncbi:MAG: alpha-glucosidase C-terminal domain-containing protein, partial [Phycisphaerae bacterium]